jgi:hypothetical protein
VVTDLIVRPLADSAFAAVDMLILAHLLGDDFTELQRCAAGGIFFIAMMPFNDFDIDTRRMISQCSSRVRNELHGDIDRQAHAGSHQDRRDL